VSAKPRIRNRHYVQPCDRDPVAWARRWHHKADSYDSLADRLAADPAQVRALRADAADYRTLAADLLARHGIVAHPLFHTRGGPTMLRTITAHFRIEDDGDAPACKLADSGDPRERFDVLTSALAGDAARGLFAVLTDLALAERIGREVRAGIAIGPEGGRGARTNAG
jgi:hypothetical protein